MKEQQKYKYIIVADGVGCADRVLKMLSGSSVLILQESENKEFWHHDLVPYKHYIPTDSKFTNLLDQIEWANSQSDERMLSIVSAANAFSKRYLNREAAGCYLQQLLLAYKQLFPEVQLKHPYPGSTMIQQYTQ